MSLCRALQQPLCCRAPTDSLPRLFVVLMEQNLNFYTVLTLPERIFKFLNDGKCKYWKDVLTNNIKRRSSTMKKLTAHNLAFCPFSSVFLFFSILSNCGSLQSVWFCGARTELVLWQSKIPIRGWKLFFLSCCAHLGSARLIILHMPWILLCGINKIAGLSVEKGQPLRSFSALSWHQLIDDNP